MTPRDRPASGWWLPVFLIGSALTAATRGDKSIRPRSSFELSAMVIVPTL